MVKDTILTPGQEITVYTRDGVKAAIFDGFVDGEIKIHFVDTDRGAQYYRDEADLRDLLVDTPTARGRERLHTVTRK